MRMSSPPSVSSSMVGNLAGVENCETVGDYLYVACGQIRVLGRVHYEFASEMVGLLASAASCRC